MTQFNAMTRLTAFTASILMLMCLSRADAQIIRAKLNEGFARTSSCDMSIDEMLGIRKDRAMDSPILGPGYPALWIAEVQYKPIRLRRIELPDPRTGTVQKELVRYMVYRVIRRDYTELAGDERAELERKLADPDLDPSNDLDPEFSLPLQMPRFLLETEDRAGNVMESYVDEVNVLVQNAVFHREMGRRGLNVKLLNSVEALKEIGDPVPASDPDAHLKAFYGVAVWRNVNPKADFFKVTMSGFSNAYRISGPPDDRVVEEKVVVQKFARPGDEFYQEEDEYRFVDEADLDGDKKIDVRYPRWEYRPRSVKLNIPDLDAVLRNARTGAAAAQ